MSLDFIHKPDYFLNAQLLMNHIVGYIKKHPDANNAIFDLRDIYELFRQDLASTTTNLEGILNIADEYQVETINGDEKIISGFSIDAENNSLLIDFNQAALQALRDGKNFIPPDATLHQ